MGRNERAKTQAEESAPHHRYGSELNIGRLIEFVIAATVFLIVAYALGFLG